MADNVRYAARVQGVQEIALRGTADAAYWKRLLASTGLTPLCDEGRARLMIVGGRLRWRGFAFREISFSVQLEPQPGSRFRQAALMLQAFNTNRFFAFSERTFFSAPYLHAVCDVAIHPPRGLGVNLDGKPLFSAMMAATPDRPPASTNVANHFGPIFVLPKSGERPSRYFIGRIEGDGVAIPWNDEFDSLDLRRLDSGPPASRHFHLSGFTPAEWTVRESAFHGKSYTMNVGAQLP